MAKSEIDELILKLYYDGLTCRQISLMLGKNLGFASSHLLKMGIKTGNRTIYDKLDAKDIVDKYLSGMTANEILSFYPQVKSENTIIKVLKNSGVTIRDAKRLTLYNDTYFSTIDTPNKAYIVGLLIADGYIIYPTNKKTPVWGICLKSDDDYILRAIIDEIEIKRKTIVNTKRGTSQISISSQKMVNDLENLGITQRKSFTATLPLSEIDASLYPHLIRGLFDGDGSLTTNGKGQRKRISICGSETSMKQTEEVLFNYAGMSHKTLYFNRFNHIYYLMYAKKEDLIKFYNYIYQDKSTICLLRKKDKFVF